MLWGCISEQHLLSPQHGARRPAQVIQSYCASPNNHHPQAYIYISVCTSVAWQYQKEQILKAGNESHHFGLLWLLEKR